MTFVRLTPEKQTGADSDSFEENSRRAHPSDQAAAQPKDLTVTELAPPEASTSPAERVAKADVIVIGSNLDRLSLRRTLP